VKAAADGARIGAVGPREERVAKNEALFREVNERIKRMNEHLDTKDEAEFICECGDADCTHPVSLTLTEYEEVRSRGTHFAVVPGHVAPDIERVVARYPRFAVVEKTEAQAAGIATREDPRA
jgi:hypothetical protein